MLTRFGERIGIPRPGRADDAANARPAYEAAHEWSALRLFLTSVAILAVTMAAGGFGARALSEASAPGFYAPFSLFAFGSLFAAGGIPVGAAMVTRFIRRRRLRGPNLVNASIRCGVAMTATGATILIAARFLIREDFAESAPTYSLTTQF